MKSRVAYLIVLCVLSLVVVFGQGRQRRSVPPAVDTVAPGIPGVVAAGTKVTVVGSDFQNTEGPVALPDGSLIFTETRGSLITKIDKDGNITPFLDNTDRANGLGFDSKGRLIAVQSLSVGVLYPKGSETTLAGPLESRPNDLVVSSKDWVYFTLPGHEPPGVFSISPQGKVSFAGEAPNPHGIQMSPDEKTLYIGDTNGPSVIAYDVNPDGTLSNRRNFGKFVGVKPTANGRTDSHADGIAVDSEGRVYVATTQGVQIFSPQAEYLGTIPISQRAQNLAFAGPDKKTLYIAGQGTVWKVPMLAQGHKGRAK